MTLADLLASSLRVIGVIATGEILDDSIKLDAIEALNGLLAEWSLDGLTVPYRVRETFILAESKAAFGIGLDAPDFTVERPTRIISITTAVGGQDYPVWRISPLQYDALPNKNQAGERPEYFHYEAGIPTATIYLYPVPAIGTVINVYSEKPFDEFAEGDLESVIGTEFQGALKWGLALRLAAEFGRQVDQVTANLADSTKKKLMRLNASRKMEPVRLFGLGGTYDITTDSWL